MLVKLKKVRLSFPAVFEPEAFNEGDTPKYKATFLIEKGSKQAKMIEDAILDCAKLKFGEKKAAQIIESIRNNPNRFCFQDGDLKDYDGYEGHMALTAQSKKRPTVVNRDKTPLTEQDGVIYAGCYVNAFVEFFGYTSPGKGISAGLGGLQFNTDGDSFGGGTRVSEDDFDDLSVEDDEDDLV